MNTDAVPFNTDALQCPFCGHIGPSIPRYKMGTASWLWCCGLFWTTYLLWVIPVCVNNCKDIEQLCDKCGGVKGVIPGNCC